MLCGLNIFQLLPVFLLSYPSKLECKLFMLVIIPPVVLRVTQELYNFNDTMATAADVTILEVEELVQPGEIGPDEVQLPGIFVNYIVEGKGAVL